MQETQAVCSCLHVCILFWDENLVCLCKLTSIYCQQCSLLNMFLSILDVRNKTILKKKRGGLYQNFLITDEIFFCTLYLNFHPLKNILSTLWLFWWLPCQIERLNPVGSAYLVCFSVLIYLQSIYDGVGKTPSNYVFLWYLMTGLRTWY